ncbi:MAG: PAS domain S-box protein [Deltaproteobacteria bacterium]|nr:PAS domain S-box protein [Deltaproteobacteria bacterium]
MGVMSETELLKEVEALRRRVTELEHCEETQKLKEQIFLDLLNATEEVVILIDREGMILAANKNAAHLYGVPLETLSGASIYDLIPGDRIKSGKEKVKTVLETRKLVRFEGKLEEKVFENWFYPVLGNGPEVQRIAIYVRDITERKRLQTILKQTEEQYKKIYENAIEGIFQIDPAGNLVSANPSLAQIHGYDSPQDLIQTIKDIRSLYVNPEDHQRLIQLLFQEGAVQNYEAKMVRKDGSLHWISTNVRLVRDTQDKPRYYEGTMMDITHRKMAEEAFAESEERYRTAIEHSNDGVAIIQGDQLQYVNKRYVEIFGYGKPEEIIGKPISLVVHPEDQDRVMTISQKRQRGEPVPSRYEFKGITRDGKVVFIEVSATSIVYRGNHVYLVYLRDISARKAAEEVLRNERNRFQILSESAPFGIIMIDREGVFQYINPKFRELFGYELNEVPNSREWFRKAFPDSKLRKELISTWIGYLRSTSPGEKVPRTLPTTCKDGTQKIIHYIPVRLATGEYIVTHEDVTERIRAHESLLKSHQELEHLNRAKTKAVHHISHELRTPLSVIQGNIRLLKQKLNSLPTDETIPKIIDMLERNLSRLSDISRETDEIFRISQELEAGVLLDNLERLSQRIEDFPDIPPAIRAHFDTLKAWFNQYQTGNAKIFESIRLYPFLLDTLEKVKHLSRDRKIRFLVEGQHHLFVLMDPLILQNVLEGLLRNAVENTPDGGTIRLGIEQKNDKIMLHIADEGVGITEENQAYIFDGLFHTKDTELYASKKPYDFGAGGKGLDLLRMKVYSQRFGFDLSMKSKRCIHIPTERDLCPGDIARCPHVKDTKGCAASGGATFTITFHPRKADQPAHI